jgi:hypothetical protein
MDYSATTVMVSETTSQATPTITTAPTAAAITYGQTLASSTLTGGVASVPGAFAFTTPTTAPGAGTASYSVTFTPTDTTDYTTATTTVSVLTNKATPTITTAPTASAITEGQTLASSTLSGGLASVPGTFSWAAPATVVSSSGSYPATFTPTSAIDYTTVSLNVPLTATPATNGRQKISFTQPLSPVTYGVAPITLSATASSGLPVTFYIASGPGRISGNLLTITGTGTVVVAAEQLGNADYAAAQRVTWPIAAN